MTRKIRILYYHRGLDFDTGSPRAMAQFIDSLDLSVFQPVYCASGDGPLPRALRAAGVEIVSGEAGSVSYLHPLDGLAAIFRQIGRLKRWKIDLLHMNGFFWNTDLVLAAWLRRIPVVLHVHNPQAVEFRNLDRFAARKVLFCSHFEMANCRNLERLAGKADVLHNAIDNMQPGGKSIRGQLGLAPADIAIGMVGQVGRRKGVDILIEAARQLLRENNSLVFLIAGPNATGEEEFAQRMYRAAGEPELRGRVRFLGSRPDIPDFLASLDLFVLPTRAEPFGIVVIEAMGAGLPVVVSKVGGVPEIVSSPEIGRLVDPVTPEAFAAAIGELLALPDRGTSMGERARRSLRGRFDKETAGRKLGGIYLDLLGAEKLPGAPWLQ